MTPQRAQIWWVDYGDPVGHEQGFRHPGLVVSAERAAGSKLFVTAPLTTTYKPYPTRVEVGSPMPRRSYVQVEQSRATSVERLNGYIGAVNETVMHDVQRVLRYLLDL